MNKFENYISEIEQLLVYKEYNQLTKRLIDLTLDTGNTEYYKMMLDHLDWVDYHQKSKPNEMDERVKAIFLTLKDALLRTDRVLDDKNKRLISINNLTKSYGGIFFTLGPINLELRENQMLGLVGENGNGKTTLLRVLAKELEITSGEVVYDFGYEDRYDLRTKLVYIPQRTPVWHGSLLDNLKFTAAMYDTKGEENELKVQLIIARMGIRTYRHLLWAGLSSGFKMRFELARALLRNPRVMLIDEPLANLDIIAQKNVLDDLKGICSSPFRPMGIILSSQQLYEVEKNADDVLFLKDGAQKNLLAKHPADTETIEPLVEEPYMIEFETTWNLAQVREKCKVLNFVSLQINGGTFIMNLPPDASCETFLKHVLRVEMPLTYFRDISKSTRRFFVS